MDKILVSFTDELKAKIVAANLDYRNGISSGYTDSEYDDLVDDLKSLISKEEYTVFRKTLTEEKGDIKTNYVLGSLEKIKYEKSEEFNKWINKVHINLIFCSEKVDGCSVELNYRGGKLVSGASRGDGNEGVDWTNKLQYINVPKTISFTDDLDVRAEFTLHYDSLEELGYANTRNGVVGIMNSKDVDPEKLKHVHTYVYEVLSHEWFIDKQFDFLVNQGFTTPKYICEFVKESVLDSIKNVYEFWKKESPYMIDGVVCSDHHYVRENVFIPKNKIAVKITENGVDTIVENITWEISKSGKLIPVCNVTATPINGTVISNVTGINAKYLCENGIGIGSKVKIQKMGEIIPKITEVIKPCTDVAIPLFCPCCSTSLVWKSVDIVCTNPDCKDATVKQVEHFIKSAGIESVSESSLRNWNIFTFNDLLKWTPDTNYKTQNDFWFALEEKVFKQSPTKIMRCFPINGIGTTNYDKLIKHFSSLENLNLFVSKEKTITSLPVGVGILTIQNATEDFNKFYKVLQQIILDSRFVHKTDLFTKNEQIQKENTNMKLQGKSFLLTGKCSKPRPQIESDIISNGGTIASGVTKTLDYLIAAIEESGSSKYEKAKKLGIKIITEEQYMEMLT